MLCINNQSRINIKKDTICSALLKKSNHDKLSSKTLGKLAKIASSSLGLYKPDAKELFINNKQLTPSGSSLILAYNITKVLVLVSNDNLRSQLKEFISHCRTPSFENKERVGIPYSGTLCSLATSEFIIKNSDRIGATVGEGAEAIVVQDNKDPRKVFKIFFDDIPHDEIARQANYFRRFYGYEAAYVVSPGIIQLDKIDGVPLSQVDYFADGAADDFVSLIYKMYEKKCPPTDMSEDNFLYDILTRKFYPIDISYFKGYQIDKEGLNYILKVIAGKSKKSAMG